MNSSFFKENRKRYLNGVNTSSVTVLFSGRLLQSTCDEEYPFEANRNFYYLSGINQDNVALVLIKGKYETTEVLFIEKNIPEVVKWVGAKLYPNEASAISGISDVRYLDDLPSFMYSVLNSSRKNLDIIETLYCDLERRPLDGFTSKGLEFASEYRSLYPQLQIKNAYNEIIGLRMYKTKEEVELIKSSIKTTKGGIEELMKHAKPGLYEYQLESYFDQYIKYDEQKTTSFTTIAAAGVNATILHYRANNSIIKDNELVLFDLGCKTNYYISDITRTFPANGKFTPRQKEIYQAVLNVNKKCIEFLKPGVTWKEYNDYANKLLISEMKALKLITKDEEFRKYYWHSIGHFIGLDTHDPGLNDVAFTEGMTMTVEPGIYVEEEAIGVRIEDDVLITKDGCINLSADIIKEVDDIEKFMKK